MEIPSARWPATDWQEVRDLIRRMSFETRLWGAPRGMDKVTSERRECGWGKGSANNIRAKGYFDPHPQAEDMTAPTINHTPQNNP
jgi:hypothetical protein